MIHQAIKHLTLASNSKLTNEQCILLGLFFMKIPMSFKDLGPIFGISSEDTTSKYLNQAIDALAQCYDPLFAIKEKGLPSLFELTECSFLFNHNVQTARFVIDGRHQKVKYPSSSRNYSRTQFFSFKHSSQSLTCLYLIDNNGFCRYISPSYAASTADAQMFKDFYDAIIKTIFICLKEAGLDPNDQSNFLILADGGFPTIDFPEIVKANFALKSKDKSEYVQEQDRLCDKAIQSYRNQVEQFFSRLNSVCHTTSERFNLSTKNYDKFMKAAVS